MAKTQDNTFGGNNTLKLILQLIRYDIPPLIVGKSSIGKSYTLIELTKRWRMPTAMLYIGSEKSENIEGIAKLISGDYDKKGEDILKFLKPYWFPQTNTITSWVKSGRKIFERYMKVYDNKRHKGAEETFQCLYQILLGLMDVEWKTDETKISVSLVEGNSNLTEIQGTETLNSKPFVFERTRETTLKQKTAKQDTLTPEEAGRDDVRDLCLYLTTILGFGNNWLVLDEIDKVEEHFNTEKYAPLLHIVRERTLKDWSLIEINEQKGLKIPFSVKNEGYGDIIRQVNTQIDNNMLMLDTRVVAIANATDKIENALFRRFCQVIMQDIMALYPPGKFIPLAGTIEGCVNKTMPRRNLLFDDEGTPTVALSFLDDVNLQWQYAFLPNLLNNSNFIDTNFNEYYHKVKQASTDQEDFVEKLGKSEIWQKTAIGKIYFDNFLGGDKDEDTLRQLTEFFQCVLPLLFPEGEQQTGGEDLAGLSSESGQLSNLEAKRALLTEMKEEFSNSTKLFWRNLENMIMEDFMSVQKKGGDFNIANLNNWTENTLQYIEAANWDSIKDEYSQIPEIGGKMIVFIHKLIVKTLGQSKVGDVDIDTNMDTDLYASQIAKINEFFEEFLGRMPVDDNDFHPLQVPEQDAEEAFYGLPEGKTDKQIANLSKDTYFGNIDNDDMNFLKSISYNNYMKRQFLSSLLDFQANILTDQEYTTKFIANSPAMGWIKNTPEVKKGLTDFRDQLPDKSLERKNIDKILRNV